MAEQCEGECDSMWCTARMSKTDVEPPSLDSLPIGSVVMTETLRSFGALEQRVWQKFGGAPDWQFGIPRHDWQSTDGGFVRVGDPAAGLAFNRRFTVLYVPAGTAESRPHGPSTVIGPDCRDGKHRACDGRGFDIVADEIITCVCTCHGAEEADHA